MYAKRLIAPAIIMTAALGVSGASAADLTMQQPSYVAPPAATAVPEVWKWTGFHFGLDFGGQFDLSDSYVDAENQHSYYGTWQQAQDRANLGAANWFISGDVGADYQVPNSQFVFGAFANYDFHPSDATASHETLGDGPCINCYDVQPSLNNPNYNNSSAVDTVNSQQTRYRDTGNTVTYGDAWGVGLRAGVLVNPRALVYVLGGYGQKEINAESYYYFNYYNGLEYNSGLSAGGWRPGWFVGAGIEAAVGKHTTLGLEYRYARYSGFSASCEIDTANPCAQSNVGTEGPFTSYTGPYDFNYAEMKVGDTGSHTVRARLSYWFN